MSCVYFGVINKQSMKIFMIICFSIPIFVQGQIDTVKIKSLIPKTNEYYAHTEFWRRIEYRDQELRKSPNIETIDEENMFAVLFYFNKFGFPDFNRLGDNAKIVRGVWGHIRYSEIKKYTFPLILKAYRATVIPEAAYREYYLRQMCQLKTDRNEYKTLPIDSIHTLLGLKESVYLSIDTVLFLLSEYKQFRSDTNQIIGRWLAIYPADTFHFEGKSLIKKGERHEVILYKRVNGKYYLMQEAFANGVEPVEVVPSNNQKTQFVISGKESSKYYYIAENKDLIYTDNTGHIFKSYLACR